MTNAAPSLLARAQRAVNHRLGAKPRPDDGRCDDLAELIPAFRERVIEVVVELEGLGFDPLVWETWRSPERVKLLVARGTGSRKSFHPLRCAVDIISRSKMWSPGPAFWAAYERACERHGLTHGAGRTRVDLPHSQALPHDRYGMLLRLDEHQRERVVTRYLGAFEAGRGLA